MHTHATGDLTDEATLEDVMDGMTCSALAADPTDQAGKRQNCLSSADHSPPVRCSLISNDAHANGMDTSLELCYIHDIFEQIRLSSVS